MWECLYFCVCKRVRVYLCVYMYVCRRVYKDCKCVFVMCLNLNVQMHLGMCVENCHPRKGLLLKFSRRSFLFRHFGWIFSFDDKFFGEKCVLWKVPLGRNFFQHIKIQKYKHTCTHNYTRNIYSFTYTTYTYIYTNSNAYWHINTHIHT